jgi:hypothetical protein
MQGNWVDSRLLMVGNRITNLTLDPSFDHNLCFKYSNGSCEPILNIYIPRFFQWYKDLLNLMGFDPCNLSLKIQESTGTSTPKMGTPLGVWVFILTLSHTPELPSWPVPLQALVLVVSPRLGLRHLNFIKTNFKTIPQHHFPHVKPSKWQNWIFQIFKIKKLKTFKIHMKKAHTPFPHLWKLHTKTLKTPKMTKRKLKTWKLQKYLNKKPAKFPLKKQIYLPLWNFTKKKF